MADTYSSHSSSGASTPIQQRTAPLPEPPTAIPPPPDPGSIVPPLLEPPTPPTPPSAPETKKSNAGTYIVIAGIGLLLFAVFSGNKRKRK